MKHITPPGLLNSCHRHLKKGAKDPPGSPHVCSRVNERSDGFVWKEVLTLAKPGHACASCNRIAGVQPYTLHVEK